jgi:hypothetical protein
VVEEEEWCWEEEVLLEMSGGGKSDEFAPPAQTAEMSRWLYQWVRGFQGYQSAVGL